MVGLSKVWKVATRGREGNASDQSVSSIPRDVISRPPVYLKAWEPANLTASEGRAAERFIPNKTATTATTSAGKRFAARIINVSRMGVAIECETPGVKPGEIIFIGAEPVTPGRRVALGMVFLFVKPLDPKFCGPNMVL